MFICVKVCALMYVLKYVYIIHIFVCVCVCVREIIRANKCCFYFYVYNVHMYICICVCVFMCTYVCMCTCMKVGVKNIRDKIPEDKALSDFRELTLRNK